MEKVSSSGVTKVNTMVISTRITFMVKENTFGLMAECIKVNGLTIKWKAKAHLHGVTAEDM